MEATVEFKCHLVFEGVDIDLAAEGDFDVFSNDTLIRLESEEDAEYYGLLVQNNLKKAVEKTSGMDFEGYIFLTIRRFGSKLITFVLMPDIQRITKLPEEIEKLEILSSIILDSKNVDSRYKQTIAQNVYLQLIQEGKLF